MKPRDRKIIEERMRILIGIAVSNARDRPGLAERQAFLAKRLSTRHRIRMPYDLRMVFCKKCKSFIAPGVNSRVRLGRTPEKAVRVSCNFCGHTYRKILKSPSRRAA